MTELSTDRLLLRRIGRDDVTVSTIEHLMAAADAFVRSGGLVTAAEAVTGPLA